MRLCSKSPACQSDTGVVYIAAVFLIAATIVIAIYGHIKTLHWHLRKVVLSGMYNCNFEAKN